MPKVILDLERHTIYIDGQALTFAGSRLHRLSVAAYLLLNPGRPIDRESLFTAAARLVGKPPATNSQFRHRVVDDVRKVLCRYGARIMRETGDGDGPERRIRYCLMFQDSGWRTGLGFWFHPASHDLHLPYGPVDLNEREAIILDHATRAAGLPVSPATLLAATGLRDRQELAKLALGLKRKLCNCGADGVLRLERSRDWGIWCPEPTHECGNPFADRRTPAPAPTEAGRWCAELVSRDGLVWTRRREIVPAGDLATAPELLASALRTASRVVLGAVDELVEADPIGEGRSRRSTHTVDGLGVRLEARREPDRFVIVAESGSPGQPSSLVHVVAHSQTGAAAAVRHLHGTPVDPADVRQGLRALGGRIGRHEVARPEDGGFAVLGLPAQKPLLGRR